MARTKTVEYPDESSDSTAIYAEHPYPTPKLIERCGKHGERLTPLSPEERADFSVERGKMEYELADPDGTALAYCEECIAESRQRGFEYSDMTDLEIVADKLTGRFRPRHGDGFADVFTALTSAVDDGLKYCPFCSEEVDVINQESGQCICPNHGEMSVPVNLIDG
jgi:hypothetical protein